jgi:hypothetical protein
MMDTSNKCSSSEAFGDDESTATTITKADSCHQDYGSLNKEHPNCSERKLYRLEITASSSAEQHRHNNTSTNDGRRHTSVTKHENVHSKNNANARSGTNSNAQTPTRAIADTV